MGNCLKRSTTDDISLLRGGNEPGRESTEQLGPSPIYSVSVHLSLFIIIDSLLNLEFCLFCFFLFGMCKHY